MDKNHVRVVFRYNLMNLRTLLAHGFRDVPHLHCLIAGQISRAASTTTTSSISLFRFKGWFAPTATPVWLLLALNENLQISSLCNLFIMHLSMLCPRGGGGDHGIGYGGDFDQKQKLRFKLPNPWDMILIQSSPTWEKVLSPRLHTRQRISS